MKASDFNARLSEAQLQEKIVARAKHRGWFVHHDRRQDLGIAGDPGFPDLVLARAGEVIFAELKREDGKLTPNQTLWYAQLDPSAHAYYGDEKLTHNVYVWRPSDWSEIQRILE